MKKIFSLLLCLFSSVVVSSQEHHVIDSLKGVIFKIEKLCPQPCEEDVAAIKAYVALGEEIYLQQPDTAVKMWKKAQLISEALLQIDPSKTVSDTAKKYLADALNDIGYIFQQKGDIPSALVYNNKSLQLSEEIDDKNGIAYSFNNLAFIYYNQGEIQKALEYHYKSLKINKEIGDDYGIANSYNNIAGIYDNQGNISKVLEYYDNSLKISEKIGDKYLISYALNNIALIYGNQGDLTKSLEYHIKSLRIKQEIDDKRGIALSYNNIGSVYYKQLVSEAFSMDNNKVDSLLQKSLSQYEMSLKINQEIDDKLGMGFSFNNIGLIYNSLAGVAQARKLFNDRDSLLNKALEYYTKGLKIREEIGNKNGIALSLIKLGEISNEQNNLPRLKEYAHRGYKLSKELGYPENIEDAAELMKKLSLKQDDYKNAYMYLEEEIVMHDSVENKENYKQTQKQQIKYEYEKQLAIDSIANAKAMEIKDLDIARINAEKKKQAAQRNLLIFGLGLMLLLAIIMYRGYKNMKKANVLLAYQKMVIEEKNTEITDSIHYAKRIQNAILPPLKLIKKHLKDSFVFYKPKDIISGDFYWMEPCNDSNTKRVLFAVCDCTGHGVPGAMVSVICNNALNRSVREFGLTDPGQILNKTCEIVIQEFEKSEEEVYDGMDIALCSVEVANGSTKLRYAGANNPLWIVRHTKDSDIYPEKSESNVIEPKIFHQSIVRNDGKYELLETKANKQPIGKRDHVTAFTTHTMELLEGDTIYIFSDGYADQSGGERGKKLKTTGLKELLMSIQDSSMTDQNQILLEKFHQWISGSDSNGVCRSFEQIDDVCIIGVRL